MNNSSTAFYLFNTLLFEGLGTSGASCALLKNSVSNVLISPEIKCTLVLKKERGKKKMIRVESGSLTDAV